MQSRWSSFILIYLIVVVAFLAIAWLVAGPFTLEEKEYEIVSVAGLSIYIAIMIMRLQDKQELKPALKYGIAWFGFFLILALGYGFRNELGRIGGESSSILYPENPYNEGQDMLIVRKSRDGHFYIRTQINGAPVRFLVDTGATNIVLAPAAARRIGFNLDQLSYTQVSQTANGIGYGA
ncbi:retropepsin-like aspartic protease family protein, partial [Magnetococcales bacterium HHB-1]